MCNELNDVGKYKLSFKSVLSAIIFHSHCELPYIVSAIRKRHVNKPQNLMMDNNLSLNSSMATSTEFVCKPSSQSVSVEDKMENIYQNEKASISNILKTKYDHFKAEPNSHQDFEYYRARYKESLHRSSWAAYWWDKMDDKYNNELKEAKRKIWKKVKEDFGRSSSESLRSTTTTILQLPCATQAPLVQEEMIEQESKRDPVIARKETSSGEIEVKEILNNESTPLMEYWNKRIGTLKAAKVETEAEASQNEEEFKMDFKTSVNCLKRKNSDHGSDGEILKEKHQKVDENIAQNIV